MFFILKHFKFSALQKSNMCNTCRQLVCICNNNYSCASSSLFINNIVQLLPAIYIQANIRAVNDKNIGILQKSLY